MSSSHFRSVAVGERVLINQSRGLSLPSLERDRRTYFDIGELTRVFFFVISVKKCAPLVSRSIGSSEGGDLFYYLLGILCDTRIVFSSVVCFGIRLIRRTVACSLLRRLGSVSDRVFCPSEEKLNGKKSGIVVG